MLAEALASVEAQHWPVVEHIVADGGSADGTLDMLAHAPNVRVIAGPDRGIYDGLNKALAAAQGDVVGWLNSDDLYAPGAFAAAAAAFESDAGIAAVCGGAQIESAGKVERIYPPDLVADLSPGAVLIGPTLPNAWFFRRSALESVGAFASDLAYAADSDFMLRFARLRLPAATAPAIVSRYRRHARSLTLNPGGASEALRRDMLRLARKWRDDGDSRIRAAAAALEGRCRTMLALGALRRGDLAEAGAHLAHGDALARGLADFVTRRIVPGLRRRRLGAGR